MSNLEEMVERLHRRGVLDSYANEVAAELVSLYNQFQSAAAAASEYSEFWEKHHGDFDQFGNYIPYSQMDGDLRAAKAEIALLKNQIAIMENRRARAAINDDRNDTWLCKLAKALEHSADYDKPEDKRRVMFSVARSLSERATSSLSSNEPRGDCGG